MKRTARQYFGYAQNTMVVTFEHRFPKIAEVGGKGYSLIRMTHAGLPVPPGFVLPVQFFSGWIAELQATPEWAAVQDALQNNEALAEPAAALQAACLECSFSSEQKRHISEALERFPAGAYFAVRSSSPEEDLEGASFAGGYKTTLGISREQLLYAIRESFASAFDERVFVYKQQQGFATGQPRIAVVVQQLIPAETAGVGFSLNPLDNDFDEAVIDANWGLGESVVAGMVSPDHFVVDRAGKRIIEKKPGDKKISVWPGAGGGVEERSNSKPDEMCIDNAKVLEITDMLEKIEFLYQHPVDIEWAYHEGKLAVLQARPITAYVPLPENMLTKRGDRRTLYWDVSLTDGITMNAPITRLTIDWVIEAFLPFLTSFTGPVTLDPHVSPQENLFFAAGARLYVNLSQFLHIMNPKSLAEQTRAADPLLASLMKGVDAEKYRASKKMDGLKWGSLIRWTVAGLWHFRHFLGRTIKAVRDPRRFFHEQYLPHTEKTLHALRSAVDDDAPLEEYMRKYENLLEENLREVTWPTLLPYIFHLSRLPKLFSKDTQEIQALADKLLLGAVGNEAIDLGVQLYRMSQMLARDDFDDLERLARRLEQRSLPAPFLSAWDQFITQYGFRGPAEMDLASARYGDEPMLALEQMAYMADSTFDPGETLLRHAAEREQAYETLMTIVKGRKRRKLKNSYEIVELMAKTRDTPKYMLVLYGGATREKFLAEGEKLVSEGRLDKAGDIFDLSLAEFQRASADPAFDLRAARAAHLPFYEKLRKQVKVFPHMIDSRGRIMQVPKKADASPDTLVGQGVSRGVASGRIKVLHSPREKPIEKGDVLLAYTTDPGWTPLFVNAEAVILEVGGVLQHGGVVAREYGKPCVSGIQGITTTLQDGQRVEVDGTNGIVRVLE